VGHPTLSYFGRHPRPIPLLIIWLIAQEIRVGQELVDDHPRVTAVGGEQRVDDIDFSGRWRRRRVGE
jgi:hypothetical protein